MDNLRARFRAWDEIEKKMWFPIIRPDGRLMASNQMGGYVTYDDPQDPLMQFTGLKDRNGKEFCIGDIADFDNGDRFQLCLEDWLEVYVSWIGEPECSDQARELYRISNAEIIGNIYESPALLEE